MAIWIGLACMVVSLCLGLRLKPFCAIGRLPIPRELTNVSNWISEAILIGRVRGPAVADVSQYRGTSTIEISAYASSAPLALDAVADSFHRIAEIVPSARQDAFRFLEQPRVVSAHASPIHLHPLPWASLAIMAIIAGLLLWRSDRIFKAEADSPNKAPEPTAVGAVGSASAVQVAVRRWLSYLR
jgi:hypothetical protein